MLGNDDWYPGRPLVVQERWRDQLWSAVPHVLVEDGDWYVTHVPARTTATRACLEVGRLTRVSPHRGRLCCRRRA
ncbi:hypothetical protein [Actinopolymorpha rutila]|uniref:Uncharacterized protein n=1 Tax=Actinopolymorpha rutila TaxID=446787 RepID=A0A852Z8D1_9ACTN|nr:hypothetical protein [Actinopolymorpha rutila]NYH88485.1 hypothetical protein [Actinopolymorpha rutila]